MTELRQKVLTKWSRRRKQVKRDRFEGFDVRIKGPTTIGGGPEGERVNDVT